MPPKRAPASEGDVPAAATSVDAVKPAVAVIGGGYLGSRIAAELGLCGCDVRIYDRSQGSNVRAGVRNALLEVEHGARPFPAAPISSRPRARLVNCRRSPPPRLPGALIRSRTRGAGGLVKLPDGSVNPPNNRNLATEGAEEAFARVSMGETLAECVAGRNLIIEAVPDCPKIKGGVFAEAVAHCAPDAILTTNTLNVTLEEINVRHRLSSLRCSPPMHTIAVTRADCVLVGAFAQRYMPQEWHDRLLGLRFLSPVMFVPLLEVTYRAGAQDSQMQRLSHMMESLEKIGASPAAPLPSSCCGRSGARPVRVQCSTAPSWTRRCGARKPPAHSRPNKLS